MGWAAVLLPDAHADARARRVWRAVYDGGFRSMLFDGENRPHVSLVVLQGQDGTLEERVGRAAEAFRPAAVSFTAAGAFGEDVIYLAPAPTAELHAMHRALTRALGPLLALADGHYLPGAWQPHMTVAYRIPEGGFNEAMRLVRASFVPFAATFTALAVVKFSPVKIVRVFELPIPPPAE